MRYITERELRDSFCRATPDSYEIPADAKLTPAARQYLIDLRLYRHPTDRVGKVGASAVSREASSVGVNGFASAAYHADGETENGAPVNGKPEHMTHLTRTRLVCKADTRIELRGRLDSLEAELLLAQLEAPECFVNPLVDALSLVRQALACDVKEQPMPDWKLDGMTAEQVHRASHHPEEFGFSGHPMPDASQGHFALLLNRLRTMSRECELCSVRAYWYDGVLEHGDLVLALNRLSSYLYILQLRAASGK